MGPVGKEDWSLYSEKPRSATQTNPPKYYEQRFDKLGIKPKPLGLFLDRWMERYRKHGRFGKKSAV